MPAFTFTSPDGQNFTINGPDGATPEQAFAILQQQQSAPKAAPAQTSQSLGFYEGAMHPFDRAALLLSKTAGAIPYVGPAIDKVGTALGMPSAEQAQQQHEQYIAEQKAKGIQPGGIGEFAGEVAGTLPAAAMGPITGGAVIGGLLSDSDTVGGTVADMLKGAAAGKVGDVALRGLAAGSKPVVRYVANKIGDWTAPVESAARDAAQYVYRLMGDRTPDDIRAAATAANGKPIIGAEAIGNTGINATAALARRAGATGDELAGTLTERAEGAGDRILGDYASAAGIAPAAARGDIDAIVQTGRDAASKQFTAALSKPGPVWNNDLAQLSQRPVIRRAIAAAAEDLKNAGKDPTALGLEIDPVTLGLTARARPTAQAWDLVKKALGQQVERDPFGKIVPDSISRGNFNIGVANRDLTSELRDSIPGYGDALDVSGDYLSLQKAFQNGQDFINNAKVTAQQVAQHVAGLSPSEVQAFKGGIANKLFDLAQNGKLSPNALDRPIFRAKLISALGPDNARNFLDNLKIEAQMKETGGFMMPRRGSITSNVLNTTNEQNQAGDALMDAIYAGMYMAHGNHLGAGTRLLSAARRMGWGARTGMMPEATRDEAGRLLMMSPADLADHLDAMGAAANPPSVGRVSGAINTLRIPARIAAPALAVAPSGTQ